MSEIQTKTFGFQTLFSVWNPNSKKSKWDKKFGFQTEKSVWNLNICVWILDTKMWECQTKTACCKPFRSQWVHILMFRFQTLSEIWTCWNPNVLCVSQKSQMSQIRTCWNPNALKSELAFVWIFALSEIRTYGFQAFTVLKRAIYYNFYICETTKLFEELFYCFVPKKQTLEM